jgi:DNA-3-methyladenine glycosylase II
MPKADPGFNAEKACKHLSKNCPVMAELVIRHGPCTLMDSDFKPFETLAASIIGQQLSVKAADTIEKRVLAAIGGPLTPEGIISVEPEALRACGLSNAKVRYVKELAARVVDGRMDLDLLMREEDDEIVVKALTELPGIGKWTAEMFLIFGMKRPDVLSLGDVGLQRAARLLYGEDQTLDMVAIRWRPYRSIASWYLWRHLDAAPVG